MQGCVGVCSTYLRGKAFTLVALDPILPLVFADDVVLLASSGG